MFTENLAQFFDTDAFGVAVVFKRGVVTIRTINAIFNDTPHMAQVYDRSFYDEKFYAAKVALKTPHLQARTVDVAGLQANDVAEIEGESDDYYITFIEPDNESDGKVSIIHLSLNQI